MWHGSFVRLSVSRFYHDSSIAIPSCTLSSSSLSWVILGVVSCCTLPRISAGQLGLTIHSTLSEGKFSINNRGYHDSSAFSPVTPSSSSCIMAVFCAVSCRSLPRSHQGITSSSSSSSRVPEAKAWSNADLGTPEFFEWLNTIPADATQRLGG